VHPALDERHVALERLVMGHEHVRGHVGADVLALVDRRERNEPAYARIHGRTSHFVGMWPPGLGKAGRADLDHVGIGDQPREVDVLGLEAAFERDEIILPDRLLERTLAGDLLQLAAQELLARVEMRIHEPGHSDAPAPVDDRVRGDASRLGTFADPDDLAVLDRDRTVIDDRVVSVERDHLTTLYDDVSRQGACILAHDPSLISCMAWRTRHRADGRDIAATSRPIVASRALPTPPRRGWRP